MGLPYVVHVASVCMEVTRHGTSISSVPLGLAAKQGSTVEVIDIPNDPRDFGDGIARHPTQLYDIVFLCVLALFFARARARALSNGMLFRLLLASYLGYRFLIEFLKPREVYFGLSTIQMACLAGLLAGARGIVVLRARPAHA